MEFNQVKASLYYFLILVYVSGAIGCFIKPAFFLPFTPFALILTLLCFLLYQPLSRTTYLSAFFLLAFGGFLLEVAGVKTGLVFGDYAYGNSLGWKLFDVPVLISANWALLINCGIILASYVSKNAAAVAFLSALMVTLIDLLIEQVACPLDYWCFSGGKAGLHNYLGWFAFAGLASYLLRAEMNTRQPRIALTILLLQLLYFSAINLSVLFNFTT